MIEAEVFDPPGQLTGKPVVGKDKPCFVRHADERPPDASDSRIDDDEMDTVRGGNLQNLDQGRKCKKRHEGGNVVGDVDQNGLLNA
jgi:hypothetical protein